MVRDKLRRAAPGARPNLAGKWRGRSWFLRCSLRNNGLPHPTVELKKALPRTAVTKHSHAFWNSVYVYPNLAENTRGLGIGGSAGTGRDGIPGFRVFQKIENFKNLKISKIWEFEQFENLRKNRPHGWLAGLGWAGNLVLFENFKNLKNWKIWKFEKKRTSWLAGLGWLSGSLLCTLV